MKKTNNKGFTLVELIVVLVILAILAAILVPALLGYIDKAREKQVTTNAEAAYVAAQSLATEAYGKNISNVKSYVTSQRIKDLTDINEGFTISATFSGKTGASTTTKANRQKYIISKFVYHQTDGTNGKYATWFQEETTATVDGVSQTIPAGGWVVSENPVTVSSSGSGN